MSKEQRQRWNLLESRSFDIYKKTTLPMIVMLDNLELNTKVSDISMETMKTNNCRELLNNNEDIIVCWP